MKPSTICIFSEDLREEKSGQDSIIGTLPDNVTLQSTAPSQPMLPKLSIYLRINFNVDEDSPKDVSAMVLNTKGELIAQSWWTLEVINQAFADASAKHLPMVGLICKFLMRGLPVPEGGMIRVIAAIDGVDYLAGILNIIVSTASSQPAAQSPSSAPQS
jgi:hypothetical protein